MRNAATLLDIAKDPTFHAAFHRANECNVGSGGVVLDELFEGVVSKPIDQHQQGCAKGKSEHSHGMRQ